MVKAEKYGSNLITDYMITLWNLDRCAEFQVYILNSIDYLFPFDFSSLLCFNFIQTLNIVHKHIHTVKYTIYYIK